MSNWAPPQGRRHRFGALPFLPIELLSATRVGWSRFALEAENTSVGGRGRAPVGCSSLGLLGAGVASWDGA